MYSGIHIYHQINKQVLKKKIKYIVNWGTENILKDKVVNILGFVNYKIFIWTTRFCHRTLKASMGMYADEYFIE